MGLAQARPSYAMREEAVADQVSGKFRQSAVLARQAVPLILQTPALQLLLVNIVIFVTTFI